MSADAENPGSENVIHNISTTVSEAEVGKVPAITTNNKMVFPADHTMVRKDILSRCQDFINHSMETKLFLGYF